MIDDNFLNMIRREAAIAVAQRQFKGTVVVTAYNKETHAIKGMLVPHGLETGWIQITGDHIGNGFGNLAGPKVGSADKLDGDQFAVEFGFGDPNTLVATHRVFSKQDKPPQVESGEILSRHENGNRVFMAKDGSMTIQHHANQGIVQFDPFGVLTLDSKGQQVNVKSGGGSLVVDAGGGSLSIKGQVAING